MTDRMIVQIRHDSRGVGDFDVADRGIRQQLASGHITSAKFRS